VEILDIIGWIGSITVILAYLLLSVDKIKPGFLYQTMNLLGAIMIAIGVFPRGAWHSFTLQIVYVIIAIVALIRLAAYRNRDRMKRKRKKK